MYGPPSCALSIKTFAPPPPRKRLVGSKVLRPLAKQKSCSAGRVRLPDKVAENSMRGLRRGWGALAEVQPYL